MNIVSLRKLLVFLVVSAIFFSFKPVAENADFSGKWKLNEGKSNFGEFGARFAPKAITVEQKADAITIAKEVTTFNGEDVTRTETLTFDGKVTESAGGFGNSKRKSTAKWSADGKALTISYTLSFEMNGETNEITGKETWTKSDDGKTFSLKTDSSSPQGEISTTAVYDKQ
jgi:hypothetical protein